MVSGTPLCFGIFWIISDSSDLEGYKLIRFCVSCDAYGIATEKPSIPLNSKSGTSYNHKAIWNDHIKSSASHKPYSRENYNHYPRGRVEISNNKAIVYLNPFLCQPKILDEIKMAFGLTKSNIDNIKIVADNSPHYSCFINGS